MPDEIKTIDVGRADNATLIEDAAQLGWLEGPVLDLTYGTHGGFWRKHRPEHLTTNDLNPEAPAEYHYDFRCTPWASHSYRTVVIDAPYKLGGTPKSLNGGEFDARFGTEEATSRVDRHTLLAAGCLEASRLAEKAVLVKCMDQVNGGKTRWQVSLVKDVLEAVEMRFADWLFLPGAIPQDPARGQQHARHNFSALLYFVRDGAPKQTSLSPLKESNPCVG